MQLALKAPAGLACFPEQGTRSLMWFDGIVCRYDQRYQAANGIKQNQEVDEDIATGGSGVTRLWGKKLTPGRLVACVRQSVFTTATNTERQAQVNKVN